MENKKMKYITTCLYNWRKGDFNTIAENIDVASFAKKVTHFVARAEDVVSFGQLGLEVQDGKHGWKIDVEVLDFSDKIKKALESTITKLEDLCYDEEDEALSVIIERMHGANKVKITVTDTETDHVETFTCLNDRDQIHFNLACIIPAS
jgi:hypothetical protein